jgi:hypothetical protein
MMQLAEKSFEIHPTVKRGYDLWRFMTPLTLSCVKCLARLLRPRRPSETQRQYTKR